MTEEIIDVSHILVNSEDRSSAEALLLASSLREQLLEDPSRFEAMVMEFSDDPSKGSNKGRFARTKRGQMVKPFEDVSFAMENTGDISEPVATAYGYHIIRLNGKFPARPMPFEEIKAAEAVHCPTNGNHVGSRQCHRILSPLGPCHIAALVRLLMFKNPAHFRDSLTQKR